MSILDDIPGADRKILDYACDTPQRPSSPLRRDYMSKSVHKVQRACRRVIATEESLSPEQRLSLLMAIDDALESAGL